MKDTGDMLAEVGVEVRLVLIVLDVLLVLEQLMRVWTRHLRPARAA